MCRLPGNGMNPDMCSSWNPIAKFSMQFIGKHVRYWSMLADGTDGMLAIPNARLGSMCPLMSVVPVAKWSCISGRWDTDVYCSKVLWARICLRKLVGLRMFHCFSPSLLFPFFPLFFGVPGSRISTWESLCHAWWLCCSDPSISKHAETPFV